MPLAFISLLMWKNCTFICFWQDMLTFKWVKFWNRTLHELLFLRTFYISASFITKKKKVPKLDWNTHAEASSQQKPFLLKLKRKLECKNTQSMDLQDPWIISPVCSFVEKPLWKRTVFNLSVLQKTDLHLLKFNYHTTQITL